MKEKPFTPKQLEALLIKHDLDYIQGAQICHVDPVTVWRYLNGKRKIPKLFVEYLKLVLANGKKGSKVPS